MNGRGLIATTALALALSLSFPLPCHAASQEADALAARMSDRMLAALAEANGVPGMGAAVVRDADRPELILIGTGSEVAVCLDAATVLEQQGVRTRVVSMPSWDRFAAQPEAYVADVLPPSVPTVSVEAAATLGWERWADEAIGIDRFGASAPGATVLRELGINPEHVVARALGLLAGES